jgi:hypothetical protein
MMNTASETLNPGQDQFSHASQKHANKLRWSAAEIATMIGGFVVFWPVGLAALGLKLFRGEMWNGASHGVPPWSAYKTWKENNPQGFKPFADTKWNSTSSTTSASGNAAFDAYKKEQLERLEAERRKLDEEQKAFAEYVEKLRRAKDQDEFDRFMTERNAPKPTAD